MFCTQIAEWSLNAVTKVRLLSSVCVLNASVSPRGVPPVLGVPWRDLAEDRRLRDTPGGRPFKPVHQLAWYDDTTTYKARCLAVRASNSQGTTELTISRNASGKHYSAGAVWLCCVYSVQDRDVVLGLHTLRTPCTLSLAPSGIQNPQFDTRSNIACISSIFLHCFWKTLENRASRFNRQVSLAHKTVVLINVRVLEPFMLRTVS